MTDSSASVSPPSRAGLKQRTVCAAIPVDPVNQRVLMVTSRKHDTKWIFPKGGHEKELGESYAEAAIRESWEEAGTPRDLLASDIGNEVHVGSSMSGDGERRIDYHVFEIEVDPDALCDDWPEAKERKREWVSVPEALARCQAWANERNTKIDLYMGFKQCRVHKRYLDSKGAESTNGIDVKVGVGTDPIAEPVVGSAERVGGRAEDCEIATSS